MKSAPASSRPGNRLTPPAPAKRWFWPLLAVGVLGAAGLAGLLAGESLHFDAALLRGLRLDSDPATPIGPPWLLQSAIDISALGGFTVLWMLGLASVAYLLLLGNRIQALAISVSLAGAYALNATLKSLFGRNRPDIVPHLTHVDSASFPSGHAMISAAIYLTIGLALAQAQTSNATRALIVGLSVLLVMVIGASRVFLGVHWPSDVMAGWAFGALWALLVFAVERRLTAKHAD